METISWVLIKDWSIPLGLVFIRPGLWNVFMYWYFLVTQNNAKYVFIDIEHYFTTCR